jgi:hypothetical protein
MTVTVTPSSTVRMSCQGQKYVLILCTVTVAKLRDDYSGNVPKEWRPTATRVMLSHACETLAVMYLQREPTIADNNPATHIMHRVHRTCFQVLQENRRQQRISEAHGTPRMDAASLQLS